LIALGVGLLTFLLPYRAMVAGCSNEEINQNLIF
jgi:hypothetical protein